MRALSLAFASGESSLSVSRFSVQEGVSSLFTVSVWAQSDDPSIDLDMLVGHPASLRVAADATATSNKGVRRWSGICEHMALVKAVSAGVATYFLRIVPRLWLLTQRRDHRIFQHINVLGIVERLLGPCHVTPDWRVDRRAYPELEYKVQHGESDYDFLCRVLEDAGISFTFPEPDELGSKLTLSDALHAGSPRPAPLLYTDNPNGAQGKEVATGVQLGHEVRPGAHVVRDHDFRRPAFSLFGRATPATGEERYEQLEYQPGAFLSGVTSETDTPSADDRGTYRHDQAFGDALAQRSLEGTRVRRRKVAFDTNTLDLRPGTVFSIAQHPHPSMATPLLLTGFSLDGTPDDAWSQSGTAVFTDTAYRPLATSRKPQIRGLQTATVVGPVGQTIYTDEFGRIRVQFPWDRLGQMDDGSSGWMRVSQEWAGTGYGMVTIPRIGEEVLVAFLDGDPDQPIIVGRLFDTTNPVPYKLPDNATRSTFKSDSSPGSDGWNEILLEDLAGSELVYQQAQKNLRRLVKNDETITVVHDRQKVIVGSEVDTTVGDRTELTSMNRSEEVFQARTTAAKKKFSTHVEKDQIERTISGRVVFVGKDDHLLVKGVKREHATEGESLFVGGSLNESFGGYSLSTWTQQEKIGRKNVLETGLALHEKADTVLVAEGTSSVTLKVGGNFIHIAGGIISIVGTLVKINAGGSPGSAPDPKPAGPERPKEADVTPPKEPPPPKLVDPTVTIGRVIRGNPYKESNANPADGMIDSVPPTKRYEVEVTVTPQLEPGRFLEMSIVNGSDDNGYAHVTPRQISTTTTVTVTGDVQTKPGKAGQLKIQATLDGVKKAESQGFTVCAHPTTVHNRYKSDIDGGTVGAAVSVSLDSDSGTVADLDQAEFSEKVQSGQKDSPPFTVLGGSSNSGYLKANRTDLVDSHSTLTPSAGPAGTETFSQLFVFKCHRCGVTDKVEPRSGFQILHRVFQSGSKWEHEMTKKGLKTTIRQWTSEAGDADVTSPIHVLT
jgi:type VI secretion system secreted protein VgrG